jgi:putative transport protein
MNWFLQLLTEESVARTVILLGVAGAAGSALGKIRVGGVSLGVAGVLFAGLFLGYLKLEVDSHVLEFVREFGLIIFVYTLGLQIGPGFFGSLRARGLMLNGFAATIVLLGAAIAAGLILGGWVGLPAGVGLLSGATTNTPSLAAAQQALKQMGLADGVAAMQGLAYAAAYPFGIIGIILTMVFVRRIFRVDVKAEVAAAEAAHAPARPKPATRNFEVRNPNLVGRALSRVPGLGGSGVVVSRFSRGGVVDVARPDTLLRLGDILHAVGPEEGLDELRVVVGADAGVDLKSLPGSITNRRLIVTRSEMFGRELGEIEALAENDVVVTRVTRGGIEFTATPGFRLQFGDVLMAVGEEPRIDAVAAVVGNSNHALNSPQPIPFFLGIALGVIVGSIPFLVPGLPAAVKLGLAGGPLIVAILLSRVANTGPLVWYLPTNANHMLREVGITLFLAAVGLKSGGRFVEVLLGGDGVRWLLFGALITAVPLVLVGLLARAWKKLNYAELCGLLAGSMTDPPALAFAQQTTASDAPAVAYATVYPLVMLLRVFTAQLIVFLLYRAAGG